VSAREEPTEEYERCPVCGLLFSEQDRATWLFLEVTRYTTDGRPGWTSGSFCSQTHAAEWLAQSLPPYEPVTIMPRTTRDRLGDLGLMAMFGVPAVLACVGMIAIGKWLGLYD
jgi:hypothetical protein